MKLSKNEKRVLRLLIENSRASDAEIGRSLGITPQGAGKIRKKLETDKVIKGYETKVDYEQMGINVMAIAMFHFTPEARKSIMTEEDLNKRVKGPHIINFYRIPEGGVTHIATYGFRSLEELDHYFQILQVERGHISEIKELYIFSCKSARKNSDKELLLKVIDEEGKEVLARPMPEEEERLPPLRKKALAEMSKD